MINVGLCFQLYPHRWKGRKKGRLLLTVILRERHMAIVSKSTIKAKVRKVESKRRRSTGSNGVLGVLQAS